MANARFANLRGNEEEQEKTPVQTEVDAIKAKAEDPRTPEVATEKTATTAAQERNKAALETLTQLGNQQAAESRSALAERDKLVEEGDASFFDKLGSEGGVATGIAALIAAATGHGDLAAGLALGGLQGASQAVQLDDARKDKRIESLEDESYKAGQQAILAISNAATLEEDRVKQAIDIQSKFDLADQGYEHSTGLTNLQHLHNMEEVDFRQKFQGRETAFQRAHEKIIQDASLTWEETKNMLILENKTALKLSDEELQVYLQGAKHDHEAVIQKRGAEDALRRIRLQGDIQAQADKMGYDHQDAVQLADHWMNVVKENPQLGWELLTASGLDAKAILGVDDPSELANISKKHQSSEAERAFLNSLLGAQIEAGNTVGAISALHSLGYDNVTDEMMTGLVEAGDLKQQKDFFYANIDKIMANMTMSSRIEVSKFLARPNNAGNFAEALELGVPMSDPYTDSRKDSARRMGIISEIVYKYTNQSAEEYAKGTPIQEFINNHIDLDDVAFMHETGGFDQLMINLNANTYTMGKQDRSMIHDVLMATDEAYAGASPEKQGVMVTQAYLERQDAERNAAITLSLPVTAEYLRKSAGEIEAAWGSSLNSYAFTRIVQDNFSADPPADGDEAKVRIDAMRNSMVELAQSDVYKSPGEKLVQFFENIMWPNESPSKYNPFIAFTNVDPYGKNSGFSKKASD